jgi:hypothetical protein
MANKVHKKNFFCAKFVSLKNVCTFVTPILIWRLFTARPTAKKGKAKMLFNVLKTGINFKEGVNSLFVKKGF